MLVLLFFQSTMFKCMKMWEIGNTVDLWRALLPRSQHVPASHPGQTKSLSVWKFKPFCVEISCKFRVTGDSKVAFDCPELSWTGNLAWIYSLLHPMWRLQPKPIALLGKKVMDGWKIHFQICTQITHTHTQKSHTKFFILVRDEKLSKIHLL